MGAIQSSLNQAMGAVAGAVLAGKHIANQAKANEAEIAVQEAKFAENSAALKNDTIEAAEAISAHEPSVNFTVDKKNVRDMSAKELNDMTPEQVNELSKQVEEVRGVKLTEDRIQRLSEASNLPDNYAKFVKGEDGHYSTVTKNDLLDKAYNAFRELNERIEVTRKLKFNRDSAEAKIKALKGGRK